jgi:hypothetical protein
MWLISITVRNKLNFLKTKAKTIALFLVALFFATTTFLQAQDARFNVLASKLIKRSSTNEYTEKILGEADSILLVLINSHKALKQDITS